MNFNIGDKIPNFELPDQNNNIIKISDLKGQKIVLYFYPKDNTPGCTIEAKDFGLLNDDFLQLNTKIIGISKDSVKRHIGFAQKYCLPFTLLSDDNNNICEEFGVWTQKSMFGKKYMGILRTTILIDENGIIKHIWPNVSVKNHAKEVLETIKKGA
jgi:thioredoxin-dependent peroxiredoxin